MTAPRGRVGAVNELKSVHRNSFFRAVDLQQVAGKQFSAEQRKFSLVGDHLSRGRRSYVDGCFVPDTNREGDGEIVSNEILR